LAEAVDHPASFLNTIYMLAGETYKKKAWQALRTVHALDYDYLCADRRALLPSFDHFMTQIEQFL
jgi:hypothetical protein